MPADTEIVKVGGPLRRNDDLVRRYGITEAGYNELLANQGGVCAICRRPETLVRRGLLSPLMVDHDHSTGRVRGLICSRCNLGLAWLEATPGRVDELVARALAYLVAEAVA